MYEASFGLKRRPFAATPDASCFLSSGPIQAALDEVVVCVEQGQGIAILTAPAGTGKTLLCERLRFELDDRYETVFLRHASFLTRRALLQTILCELNHSYHHPSEQELRLELLPVIRALQPKREALVLICDEAHQFTDSLLEELRILADFAENGRPLVRLVLVGQLSLEEKLAQPALEAFNQRIRAHVNLSTFDRAGTLDYIDYRLTWSGGRTNEIFTPAALDLIAQASDGLPRCINQLADHTLLLAFVADQRPAGEELVREALSDLRQLPLHWNEPPQSLTSSNQADRSADVHDSVTNRFNSDSSGYLMEPGIDGTTYSFEPVFKSENEKLGIDSADTDSHIDIPVPHDLELSENVFPSKMPHFEVGSPDWKQTLDLFHSQHEEQSLDDTALDIEPESATVDSRNSNDSIESRQFQFHSLLQDAFAAVGISPLSSMDTPLTQAPNASTASQPPASPIGVDFNSSTLDAHFPPIDLSLQSFSIQSRGDFHEEIIIDRYASIDAGLEPPSTPPMDTTNAGMVRADQQQFSGCLHETPNELVAHATDERCTVSAKAFECSFLEESDSYDCNRIETGGYDVGKRSGGEGYSDHGNVSSFVKNDSASSDQLGRVAEEVRALAEALRPSGALGSSSDAIVNALRDNVEELSASVNHQANRHQGEPVPLTQWESIETELVPETTEARPFRNLFSRLRRKQNGLA